MQLSPVFTVLAIVAGLVEAYPINLRPRVCSDLKRDLILKGELAPEACCSYGRCLGDVVIAMA
ncbi:hypothetical protein QBC38DRAFT_358675 [Podospora fimiseda]|uniref:Uncharacterized protein n=1 Tax=Podospora fimiseda TaxID=252190 RepID=A0AAN7BU99_9PEZI|nr:hypothetical protein QBC38DRAFT_358675 [Podospora fimiseda]